MYPWRGQGVQWGRATLAVCTGVATCQYWLPVMDPWYHLSDIHSHKMQPHRPRQRFLG